MSADDPAVEDLSPDVETAVSNNRVACRRCGEIVDARPLGSIAGLPFSRCPECRRAALLPLPRGWRVFWWLIAVLTAATGVVANLTIFRDHSWIPGGVGLLSFVVLCLDVGIRHRRDRGVAPGYVATLAIAITVTLVASILGALVVAGLNGSYVREIVDRPAGPTIEVFVGFDLVEGDTAICRGGQDYWACTAMHNTMWNALCTGSALNRTSTAELTCSRLRTFIDDAWARYQSCGYGCETAGGSEADWGWSNLRPSPVTRSVPQPAITHDEVCYFALGPIMIGECLAL